MITKHRIAKLIIAFVVAPLIIVFTVTNFITVETSPQLYLLYFTSGVALVYILITLYDIFISKETKTIRENTQRNKEDIEAMKHDIRDIKEIIESIYEKSFKEVSEEKTIENRQQDQEIVETDEENDDDYFNQRGNH